MFSLQKCPSDWLRYSSSCYAYINTPLNVDDAMARCHQDQGYLVAINHAEENSFLTETFGSIFGEIYIGAQQDENEKSWWLNEDPWQFESWDRSIIKEPNNSWEKCVVMAMSGWRDVGCRRAFPFICEKPLNVD